jgi:hypothetical protein
MNPSIAWSLPFALFLGISVVAGCSVGSVSVWATERRREREAYYRSEVLKKIAEAQGSGAASALEFLHQDQRNWRQRVREGTKLGGLIAAAVGIALTPFLMAVVPQRPVYLAGLIPVFVGFALLIYSYILGPKG